jgi:hypothetical protein
VTRGEVKGVESVCYEGVGPGFHHQHLRSSSLELAGRAQSLTASNGVMVGAVAAPASHHAAFCDIRVPALAKSFLYRRQRRWSHYGYSCSVLIDERSRYKQKGGITFTSHTTGRRLVRVHYLIITSLSNISQGIIVAIGFMFAVLPPNLLIRTMK